MSSLRAIPLSIVGLLLAALASNSVRAEVRVQGHVENIRLDARDATVAEILVALHERFELNFRGTTASRHVTGIYEGPLRHILARVLEGNDYVIEPDGANIDVVVLSNGVPREVTLPAPIVRRRAD